jgi:hypothetical protein
VSSSGAFGIGNQVIQGNDGSFPQKIKPSAVLHLPKPYIAQTRDQHVIETDVKKMPFRPIKHPKIKVKTSSIKRGIIKRYEAKTRNQTE